MALEPSGHRDRAGYPSKNRLAVLGTAYVGVLSDERGSPLREFNPCACSHQYGLPHPRRQQLAREEASGEGTPPLLIGRSKEID